jgi:glycosyltransferase involved in cell wall biosynthesis
MDALWSASTYSKNAFREMGVRVPIQVVPWPVEAPQSVPAGLPDGKVYDLDRCLTSTKSLAWIGHLQARWLKPTRAIANKIAQMGAKQFLSHLVTSSRTIPAGGQKSFLCVAQDVPRKGLLLFLSEWMEFKRTVEGKTWNLILKSTPYNTGVSRFHFVCRFWEHVQAIKAQLDVSEANVYLWADDLDSSNFNRLVNNTFASVCPSLGEGFCGPAALALSLGKPLIAPRHTAFEDYLAADYAFAYPSRPVKAQFVDDVVGLYAPYSTWNVPEPGALAAVLQKLVTDDSSRLLTVTEEACANISRWCRPSRVRRLLAREVEWIGERDHQFRVAS